ncbi:MAG: hypothetical protein ACTHOU_02840 [Aureliella sp.]
MSRSRWLFRLMACGLISALASQWAPLPVLAGPPSILNMFQERTAQSAGQDLVLKDENGPWLILAMVLSGDQAEQQAIELATELRALLRTEVYIHRKEFDYSQPLAQASARLVEGEQQKVYKTWYQHANAVHEKNYAVLVGNYTSPDDPRVPEMLKRVKTARPKCLNVEGEKPTAEEVKEKDATWLIATKRMLLWQKNSESAKKGPMGAAFVTRNPLLPDEYFKNAVDDFVVRLNENVEHSLLRQGERGGRYTVRVATFNGRTVTELSTGMSPKKETLDEISDALDEACLKAGQLTAALRAKGVEAYEFHDRTASYVTIGIFDNLGQETPTGQFVYNPEMVSIMNQYCGYEMLSVRDPKTGFVKTTPSCKTLDNIPFDVEGKFISVPRPAASKLYGGALLGKSRVGQ